MGKNLVIVESPAKARTINKILGKDYVVKASMGHVRDLPERKLGVSIDKNFEPEYVSIKGRQKVLTELRKAAGECEKVYLAPDPDREGEAIAWHLAEELKKQIPEDHFYRVTYNEITAPAIRASFENPERINMNKVDAQQARRILDRIVGYKVSPLLWRRIKGGSSAGRVQSVALRLVCEREDLIDQFVPEEYWILGAKLAKRVDPKYPFEARLTRINGEKAEVKNGEQAEKIRTDLEASELKVLNINRKEISKKARPPFITSSLQQAASSFLSFSPSRTMSVAQRLYEGVDFGEGPVGLITYMRTDSFSIAKEAQASCRAFVGETFGADYVPEKPNFYRSRKSAQEAHEAIRPTDATRTPDQLSRFLKPEELKLYTLIWKRFVASQMAPARIAQNSVEIEAATEQADADRYLFRASASEILFPGYMKVTGEEKKKKNGNGEDENGEEIDQLPPLTEGEGLDCLEWLADQKETQPPPRFSEASLVRALEENGVGRPSTYAQTISTLYSREYVEKEKRTLKPTTPGRSVNTFLVEHLNELFDVGFTAEMEEKLDKVENGSVEWHEMLAGFYETFVGWLEKAKGPKAEEGDVRNLLATMEPVSEWEPERQVGKRKYSDEKFVTSIREQLDKKEKAISERQLNALKKVVCRYKDQIPGLKERAEELKIVEEFKEAEKPKELPRETTLQKLDLMRDIKFEEPRKVGKRTYDDDKFCTSLRQQVESGKRLSENQLNYLDRLVLKYAEQVPDFEAKAEKLELNNKDVEEDGVSGPILELMQNIKTWNPPVQRGKRTWDDQEFFNSLSTQYKAKKTLSPRQLAALKKMIARYAAQIPDYEKHIETYGLPEKKKKKEKKAEA